MKFPKKTVWTLALWWGLYYLWSNYAPEIWNTVGTVVWWIQWILEPMSNAINSWVETLVWTAAPFAFPMIAWWYAGKKLSDAMWIEWKWKKRAMSALWVWVWAWLWFAASSTVLAPALTVAWTWYAAYKWFKWWKYLLKKWYGWLKGWIKWAYNWVKNA